MYGIRQLMAARVVALILTVQQRCPCCHGRGNEQLPSFGSVCASKRTLVVLTVGKRFR